MRLHDVYVRDQHPFQVVQVRLSHRFFVHQVPSCCFGLPWQPGMTPHVRPSSMPQGEWSLSYPSVTWLVPSRSIFTLYVVFVGRFLMA